MSGAVYPISAACYGMSGQGRSAFRLPLSFSVPFAAGAPSLWNMTMSSIRIALLALVLATPGFVSPGFASPVPMSQEKHINDELRAGFAGDTLRKICPTISARMLVVMGRLWDLKSYAEAQGYTADDYDAFRKDPVQKKRLKDEAEAYLEAAGAKPGDVESYCKVGEAEIAKDTPVGQLLRSSR